jgi:Reverse transcriptase (RNA-dependent DNA polymerase)
MRNIPSSIRSERVITIAEKYNLIEPFRYLYPNRRDFSYIPNAIANRNRSRIDYFLVNKDTITSVNDSGLSTEKLTNLFDHKMIFLELGTAVKKIDRNKINTGILDNPKIKLAVELSVKEAYLNNADLNAVPRYTINTLRSEIGRVFSKLSQATDLELSAIKENSLDNDTRIRISTLVDDAVDISETIPELEFFENLPVTVLPDIFFEGLILSVKNEVLSKQSAIFKIKKFKKKVLRENIWRLKHEFEQNFDEIKRQETILNNLVDEDLKLELENYQIYERVNQEKITPYFMNLIRNDSKQNSKLSVICDDDGNNFNTGSEREDYITDFYAKLYKKPNSAPVTENCITDFLGDIADHPAVLESKLSEEEKNNLDSEIDIRELDNAVLQSKLKSSPGIDGISNKFIKKFWPYFRVPLFKYTTHCLSTGTLTENFRLAKIRLIPKKTDPKKISNWRPISLLNCFYKIISRVLSNRLKKYSDKITLVGQKGYSNTKWCQEVAISIIDTIFDAKEHKKKGCIVSLDIKKAFDSISHDFIKSALKFFNIGDTFIGWIMTICTGRKACIILDSGNIGNTFTLERGNAQGDVISPFIFNICYQILLLKIEFNLQIKSIGLPDPPVIREELVGVVNRVSHRAKKVFAFADDCNVLAAFEPETIREILKVLSDFGIMSGLECNVQKSNILPIGHEPVTTDEIRALGFAITDEITVLGFKINNGDQIFDENANSILDKITKQKRIWCRYNLSLPGRINISKTMLYSQLNYIGCVIPIQENVIKTIETSIYKFVSGNLRIARERVFLPVESGGLGLFDIKNFLDAQSCSWIRRARIIDQDWKARLIGSGAGNIHCISSHNIKGSQYPVLHHIASAFDRFRKKFTASDNNYKVSHILFNEGLTTGIRSKKCLEYEDILPDTNDDLNRINILTGLKISDLIINGRPLTKNQFTANIGFNITNELWQKLEKIRSAAKTKYGSDDYLPVKSSQQFFAEWKKGSKKIRLVLGRPQKKYVPHNMIKYAENTETVIGLDNSEYLNKFWNRGYFSNDFRVFIFKLHSNTLPYNTILSHFVRDVGRNCTFCNLTQNPEEEDENVLHFFYNCTTSENLRVRLYRWITNNNRDNATRREFFCGFRELNNYHSEFLNIVTKLLKKFLWDSRTRKSLPAFDGLKTFITDEVKTMTKVNKKAKQIFIRSGIDIRQIFNIHDF